MMEMTIRLLTTTAMKWLLTAGSYLEKDSFRCLPCFDGSDEARYIRSAMAKRTPTWVTRAWRIGETARSKDFPQLAGERNHSMKRCMPGFIWNLCLLTLALLSGAACTAPSVRHEEAVPPLSPAPTGGPEDRRVLAGEWEYEDGGVVTLTLDEQGNGTYPWKDGHFITHSLSDHVWQGIWVQKQNDREGGFSLQFSPDFSEGDGRWWYTRIEDDRAPTQKGGTFHLTKQPSRSDASELSPTP